MDQNKLYVDNWFKKPPLKKGAKHAEKSHKKTYKRKAKKRG